MATNNQSQRQTIEQERAKRGWRDVNQVQEANQKRYTTLARKLASMIQINGLGSTLAFILSKAGGNRNSAEQQIYNHLSNYVTLRLGYSDSDLMQLVRDENVNTYRRATAESIEYAVWLSRYVSAMGWEGEAE
ncbi:MAG: type III-B CRISPR module-associated protein Cmr5 [Chloroflexota bacterium]